jgi:hypothetical protein
VSEALFWHLMGVLLLLLGAVALATAVILRARRQRWRVPLLYAVLALVGAVVLLVVVGR